MFKNCEALITLYLHYFEIKEALGKEKMFDGCDSLINKYFFNSDNKINDKNISLSGSNNNKVNINESDDQKSSVFSNEKFTKVFNHSNDETKDKITSNTNKNVQKNGKNYTENYYDKKLSSNSKKSDNINKNNEGISGSNKIEEVKLNNNG